MYQTNTFFWFAAYTSNKNWIPRFNTIMQINPYIKVWSLMLLLDIRKQQTVFIVFLLVLAHVYPKELGNLVLIYRQASYWWRSVFRQTCVYFHHFRRLRIPTKVKILVIVRYVLHSSTLTSLSHSVWEKWEENFDRSKFLGVLATNSNGTICTTRTRN